MTALPLTNLIFEGTSNYTLTRHQDVVTLSHAAARTCLPLRNIDALSYRRIRYPFFLALALVLLLGSLYMYAEAPYFYGYQLNPAAFPLLGALVSFALYFLAGSSSLHIHAGSFRATLRGSEQQIEQALELMQR